MKIISLLIFLSVSLFFKSLIIFIVPGILILFLPVFNEISLIEISTYIIGISVSFWVASFWLLKFIPLNLINYFYIIVLLVIFVFGVFLFRGLPFRNNISIKKSDCIVIVLFLLLAVLRFLPMYYLITPAGGDMSMHTYITELIVDKNGVPQNYSPILGINEFNTFPVGFHTVSALVSLLDNIPPYRSAFIVMCLTYVFLTLFLYVFLLRFVSWRFAFISAVAFTFFTINPQGFADWGGNPSIFAFDFLILFLAFLFRIKERSNLGLIIFAALSLSTVMLGHTIIAVEAAYIIGVSYGVYFLMEREYRNYAWVKYALILVFTFLFLIPYLFNLDTHITTPDVINSLRGWVGTGDWSGDWHGIGSNSLWTIPAYIMNYDFGIFRYVIFLCLGGFVMMFLRKKEKSLVITFSVFLVMCWLLILNTHYWFLPLSYAIYPERTAIMVIIPLSLFFAFFMEHGFKYLKHIFEIKGMRVSNLNPLVIVIIFVVSAAAIEFNKVHYIDRISLVSSVTSDDMDAFMWLKNNTDESTLIANNYGDAGIWIPSIILRQVTIPHIDVAYEDKIIRTGIPTYVYVGENCVYPFSCLEKASDLLHNTNYQLVYSKGLALVFKKIQ